jgi:hypothetical protein
MVARVLVLLPALAVLALGTAGAVDESVLLAGLLGMAMWLVGALASPQRATGGTGAPGPGVRGQRRRDRAAEARQWDPDAAGRMRARAPAGVPAAV